MGREESRSSLGPGSGDPAGRKTWLGLATRERNAPRGGAWGRLGLGGFCPRRGQGGPGRQRPERDREGSLGFPVPCGCAVMGRHGALGTLVRALPTASSAECVPGAGIYLLSRYFIYLFIFNRGSNCPSERLRDLAVATELLGSVPDENPVLRSDSTQRGDPLWQGPGSNAGWPLVCLGGDTSAQAWVARGSAQRGAWPRWPWGGFQPGSPRALYRSLCCPASAWQPPAGTGPELLSKKLHWVSDPLTSDILKHFSSGELLGLDNQPVRQAEECLTFKHS